MKKILLLLVLVLALCVMGVQAAEVVWYDGHQPITYSVPKKVESVVKVALELWKNDMQQVTGLEPVMVIFRNNTTAIKETTRRWLPDISQKRADHHRGQQRSGYGLRTAGTVADGGCVALGLVGRCGA